MRVMVSAVGQHDNVGDTVLRRAFLDALREIGPLHVYIGDRSEDYLSGLGLRQGDIATRQTREWRRAVSRHLLRGGVYAFDTGETEVRRRFARRYATLGPLLLANRMRGGTAVQLGVGVRESTPWRLPIGAVLRLCEVVSWRDALSRRIMGFGEVTPDWAFALGSDDDQLLQQTERPLLAVAVRQSLSHAARDKPDDAWVAAVRGIADELGLQIAVVAQITRDGPLAQELAERLGGEAVVWADANHARHEERLRETYRRSLVVLGDRLHAVVIAVTEGAVPIALSTGRLDKVSRTLEGAGITGTSVDRRLADPAAALETVRDAVARRDDILAAVISSRGRLRDLMVRVTGVVERRRRR